MSSVGSADLYKLAGALKESAQNSATVSQTSILSSASFIKADMEQRVPVRTGRLKQSIAIRVEGDQVIIGPHTEYANFVEFGTRPHIIKAKNKKALAFRGPNGMVFVKQVHHPGTKPHPYVRPAFEDWVQTLGTNAAQANVQRFYQDAR